MYRLFTAIALPDQVRQRLALMSGGIPGARWVTAENMHLTLRFIGDVDPRTADTVHGVLNEVAFQPFDAHLQGISTFGERIPRILYVNVAAAAPLQDLYERINMVLARAGLPPPEERRYVPHVTLARLGKSPRHRIGEFVVANNILSMPPFQVEQFVLMSSHRTNRGASYQIEASYPDLD